MKRDSRWWWEATLPLRCVGAVLAIMAAFVGVVKMALLLTPVVAVASGVLIVVATCIAVGVEDANKRARARAETEVKR